MQAIPKSESEWWGGLNARHSGFASWVVPSGRPARWGARTSCEHGVGRVVLKQRPTRRRVCGESTRLPQICPPTLPPRMPNLFIIAGPNGAGVEPFAAFLQTRLATVLCVSPDSGDTRPSTSCDSLPRRTQDLAALREIVAAWPDLPPLIGESCANLLRTDDGALREKLREIAVEHLGGEGEGDGRLGRLGGEETGGDGAA